MTAVTETSFTEYVCTENSCAAVVMPEGTTAASSIGGGLVSCEANLTLNTYTEPTRCVIACDEANGYIYQLGTLNCLPSSSNGAALITNTNSSTFTCEPVRGVRAHSARISIISLLMFQLYRSNYRNITRITHT